MLFILGAIQEAYMSTKAVTDANFEAEVISKKGTVLVDFWAEWCGPCRALGPKLEEISSELGEKASILKLNVDDNPATAAKFGVRSIPMMLVFKDGQAMEQMVGNQPKDNIKSLLEKYI